MPFYRKNKPDNQPRPRRVNSSPRLNTIYYSSYKSQPADNNRPPERHAAPAVTSRQLLTRWFNRFGRLVFVIAVFALAISLLQVGNRPAIKILNQTADFRLHDDKTYEQTATASLRGSILNSNKLTIDTKSVTEELKANYPEVENAALILPVLGHQPQLVIELTRPALILISGNQSALIDDKGYALAVSPNPHNFDSLKFPKVVDQSQLALQSGQLALGGQAVNFISTVVTQLAANRVIVSRLSLPAGTEELDVYLGGTSYYAKFNLYDAQSVNQQIGTLLAVKHQLSQQGSVPKQYIDVRLVGRAYYL